jgi:hypothetical protein
MANRNTKLANAVERVLARKALQRHGTQKQASRIPLTLMRDFAQGGLRQGRKALGGLGRLTGVSQLLESRGLGRTADALKKETGRNAFWNWDRANTQASDAKSVGLKRLLATLGLGGAATAGTAYALGGRGGAPAPQEADPGVLRQIMSMLETTPGQIGAAGLAGTGGYLAGGGGRRGLATGGGAIAGGVAGNLLSPLLQRLGLSEDVATAVGTTGGAGLGGLLGYSAVDDDEDAA